MGVLDKNQKNYFEDSRRFADVWNTLFFQGEVIDWHDLREANAVFTITGPDGAVEKIADMVMKKTGDGKMLALYVLENQSSIDYSMSARACIEEVMAYDQQIREIKSRNRQNKNTEYVDADELLNRFRKEDRLRPVTTLVLYWGDKPWDGAMTLEELIDFNGAEELMGSVPQYKLHLVNMSTVENIEAFQTDMRSLVECFQRRNDSKSFGEYIATCEERYELDSTGMRVLGELVKSAELKQYLEKNKTERKGKAKMCKAITELIAEGREEGRKQEQQNTIRERLRAEQAEKEIELLKQRLQELSVG